MSVFDIERPDQFFHSICSRYRKYQQPVQNGGRTTEDIIYVIMGLNHLREWIAPESSAKKYRPTCTDQEKQFSSTMYDDPNFTRLRHITNGTKHLKVSNTVTTAVGGTSVDEWPDWDAALDVDAGLPSEHLIDGEPARNVIDPVVAMYQEWFDDLRLK